jgi:hypothetical protein
MNTGVPFPYGWPGYWPYQPFVAPQPVAAPAACPGCNRCMCCGRPIQAAPVYYQPFWTTSTGVSTDVAQTIRVGDNATITGGATFGFGSVS